MTLSHLRRSLLLLALLTLLPRFAAAQPFWPDPGDYYPEAPDYDQSDTDWLEPQPALAPPSSPAPVPTTSPAYVPFQRWSAPPTEEELDIEATLQGEYNQDTGRARVTLRFDIENAGRESRDAHDTEVWLRDPNGRLLTHARAAPMPLNVSPGTRRTSSQTILTFRCPEDRSFAYCLQHLSPADAEIWNAAEKSVVRVPDDE